jgi:signal transduction histidine kinase
MTDMPAKILLVDDVEANLWALSTVLRQPGVELLQARSGQEALELLLVHDVALAIIDVQMPGLDGFQLAELMRGVHRTRLVPIMFVTAGLQGQQGRFRGYEAGAVDFLFKPVEPEILQSKARIFLDLYHQRRELVRHRDQLASLVDEKSHLLEEQRRTETALRASEERLRSFSQELERRVDERTEELRKSQERLRALALELNLAEQRERKRIAGELHDYLAQMLVLGRMKLDQAKRRLGDAAQCADLIGQADEALKESLTYTRGLVHDLSPPVLFELGLPAALRWLAERMQQHDVAVEVTIHINEVALPEDQAVLLFQSARELLVNSAKHSGTGQATVELAQRDGCLRLTVRDEGKGFDPRALSVEQPTPMSSKFGLFSIRERMKSIGGRFELTSSPGSGTSATLIVPIPAGKPAGYTAAGPRAMEAHRMPPKPDRPDGLPDSKIRVLLVDDNALLRRSLRSLLEGAADMDVVGEAENGERAVTLAIELRPTVVVMDINMPKMNGIEATAHIKQRAADVAIVGLSVSTGTESQQAMRAAGAAILLNKESVATELEEAIRRASMEGQNAMR